jgi:hypothetical protein
VILRDGFFFLGNFLNIAQTKFFPIDDPEAKQNDAGGKADG